MERFLQVHVGALENTYSSSYRTRFSGKEQKTGVEKSRIPDLVDCSLQQRQKQASDQASLALDCYNTPGMLSCTDIHHGEKKQKKTK